jgi:hypothetical protein
MGNARSYNVTILKKVSMEEAKKIIQKYRLHHILEARFFFKETMHNICILTNKNELNKMFYFHASGSDIESDYTKLFKCLEKENIIEVVYGIDDYTYNIYDEYIDLMRTFNNWILYRNNKEIVGAGKITTRTEPKPIEFDKIIIPYEIKESIFEPEKFGIKLPEIPQVKNFKTGKQYKELIGLSFIHFSLNFVFYKIFNDWYFYRVTNNHVFENKDGEVFLPKQIYLELPCLLNTEIVSNEEAEKVFHLVELEIKRRDVNLEPEV